MYRRPRLPPIDGNSSEPSSCLLGIATHCPDVPLVLDILVGRINAGVLCLVGSALFLRCVFHSVIRLPICLISTAVLRQ